MFCKTLAGACLIAAAALLSAPGTARAQSAAVMSREQLQALIDESDKALKNLVVARDQTPPPSLAFKRDKRGSALTDDLRQHVVPPDTQKKLEALEARAKSDLEAGDLPGVQVELAELRRGLKMQIEEYQAIVEYWSQPTSLPVAEDASRKATLQANGIQAPNQAEIDSLEAQLDKQIAAADFITAMRATWPKLGEAQRQARSAQYQQLISKLDGGGLQGLRSATPTRQCVPVSGATTSGTDVPNTRPDFPPVNDYFPLPMARQGIKSGTPEVFVIVDAKGCPERAVLVGPSEHEEFDDAGLRLAVAGRYVPAVKDGNPVRAGFFLRLNFFNPL
jgi:hypothetical protein